MTYDTVEAIRSWPVNDSGWHVEPETNRWIGLGNGVRLGNDVTLGNGVRLPSVNIAGYIANPYAPGSIRIGCEIHTVKEWRRTAKAIAAKHYIEAEQVPAMLTQLNWLAGWFEAYPEAMTKTVKEGSRR